MFTIKSALGSKSESSKFRFENGLKVKRIYKNFMYFFTRNLHLNFLLLFVLPFQWAQSISVSYPLFLFIIIFIVTCNFTPFSQHLYSFFLGSTEFVPDKKDFLEMRKTILAHDCCSCQVFISRHNLKKILWFFTFFYILYEKQVLE